MRDENSQKPEPETEVLNEKPNEKNRRRSQG
jgi:hypothetical protein